MLSETVIQLEYNVAAEELARELGEPIGRYVNVEMRHPVTDRQILNWLVSKNRGRPYDSGYLQFDLNIDIVHSALKKAHRSGKVMTTKEDDDITAYPIDWDFGIVLVGFY